MENKAMVRIRSRDELMELVAQAVMKGVSWEALRWRATCVDVDCDQGSEAFACYEAVDEWRRKHSERYGHQVEVKCEWDCPDGTVVCASEESAVHQFGGWR